MKPKEPPAIQKRYLAATRAEAEPEDRKLSFCVAEYLKSLEDCLRDTVSRARHFLVAFSQHAADPKISPLKATT